MRSTRSTEITESRAPRWRVLALATAIAACTFDPAYRDVGAPLVATCTLGTTECRQGRVETCTGNATSQSWSVIDDCVAAKSVCAPTLLACKPCLPAARTCDGQRVTVCTDDGAAYTPRETCDTSVGVACRSGSCVNLCADAAASNSNVGCEYWAVDLDNAVISASLNAAAQQFAVVVSNAEEDVAATVVVEEDTAGIGMPASIRTVGKAVIAPRNLEVFKLGPKEVDGSADGTFDTGTGTALTRHAYRVTSSSPIVAYQFNPLENANVFSNDASQLLPTSALNRDGQRAYIVAGWPQTIANSSVPQQNFGQDLRAFLTVVATRPDTQVRVRATVRVIAGGPFPSGLAKGDDGNVMMQPFDVLNLETGEFNGDFTGSLVDANQPVAVFVGSEASDAPFFASLADRSCCADHLEEQSPPVRAVGKSYVVARMPNRSRAVVAAGGNINAVDEPEYYRVVAARSGATHVRTTLPAPDDAFELANEGESRTLIARQDFTLNADSAVILADVQASQEAAGVPRGLPGGDPSLTYLPPAEQWRATYVLLTPDKYSFDFVVVSAPAEANVFIDGLPIGPSVCDVAPADGLTVAARGGKPPAYLAYRCQLSFPIIDPTVTTNNVSPGRQNDGVHRVQADLPVGVIVYGFDSFVSYAYAGGTQLTEINVK